MIRRKVSTASSRISRLQIEHLEHRRVLAAYPAYVDGAFTFGDATASAPYGLDNTFLLESLPGAEKTIYLDFDGHLSQNNSWGHNIDFPPFNTSGSPDTFTDNELVEIQRTWQNVAEDFLPFEINVTTKDPGVEALRRSPSNDTEFGVRVVATQATNGFGNGIGGVAQLNSFNDSLDNPVFAFNKGARNGGMTHSHEVGHALGLSHDGLFGDAYHPGTGSGPTGWGPIMGAPFGKVVTQWSNGDYAGSTTTQNDLARITRAANGFGYRTDDFGGSLVDAHQLVPADSELSEWGIIERNTDVDMFEFETAAGDVTLSISTFAQDANLDVLAVLYDSNGNEIASSDPLTSRNASFNENLAAGTYFVSVEGTGRDDGRYSDYGSLGFYTVTGSVVTNDVIDGDFNDDGLWNINDINDLITEIAGAGNVAEYDLTGDGEVDLDDRNAWLAEAGAINLPSGAPYLAGDINLDATVDGLDFIEWNNNKFTNQTTWQAGDLNADNVVDGLDFLEWNDHKFMSSADTARVPDNIRSDASLFDLPNEGPFWPLNHDEVHGHEGEHHDELAESGPNPFLTPSRTAADAIGVRDIQYSTQDRARATDLAMSEAGYATKAMFEGSTVTAKSAVKSNLIVKQPLS